MSLRSAVARVVTNAMNYPPGVDSQILGRDLTKLIDKLVEAVEAEQKGDTNDDDD